MSASREANPSILYSDAILLEGHKGAVLAADFNVDGSLIALAGVDETLLLWGLPTDEGQNAKCVPMQGHDGPITTLAWHPYASDIVTGGSDLTLGLWDPESGTKRRKFVGHTGPVNSVAYGADGTIFSAGDDGTVRLWDAQERNSALTITSEYPVLSVELDHTSSTIYVAGIDPEVKSYDLRRLDTPLWTVFGEDMTVTSLAINRDNTELIVRYMDGPLRTINVREFVPAATDRLGKTRYSGLLYGVEKWLGKACYNIDGSRLYAGSEDGMVLGWDTGVRKSPAIFHKGHRSTVIDVKHHPTESIILLTSTDSTILVREL